MSKGRFGVHGGQYIPETLMNAMLELEERTIYRDWAAARAWLKDRLADG